MILDRQLEKFHEGSVYIWTDGACKENPGPGGYAAYIFGWYTDKQGQRWAVWREDMGSAPMTTNNRMELQAAILGLSLVNKDRGAKIVLYSDSKYVVQGMQEWLPAWVQRNGVKSDGEPVKNWDLWLHLHNFMQRHSIRVEWVKGHDGNKWNERVDQMAQWMAEHPTSGANSHNRRGGREKI